MNKNIGLNMQHKFLASRPCHTRLRISVATCFVGDTRSPSTTDYCWEGGGGNPSYKSKKNMWNNMV